jgi:hypothetical protein
LSRTELTRAQFQTIRLKLFKIAAQVKSSVRWVVFHLASGYPYPSILIRALGAIQLLPYPQLIFHQPQGYQNLLIPSMGERGRCDQTVDKFEFGTRLGRIS